MVLPTFHNPYWGAGSVLAKLAVNWATLCWAVLVLVKHDALHTTAYGWTDDYVHEDIIAGVLALIAVAQLVWLARHCPPLRWGCSGYGVFAFFWLFVFFAIGVSDAPLQPTALAGSSTVAGLAVWAFAANPKGDKRGVA